ncbi:beta-lactamase-like protein [Chaetomium fimeti]|uniref:Beta-lactamase-like protein n=1 Tax=Chaetomium fimeti TaxID=1854472 RepID=A0AAE0HPZ5_9PEZI|nr:beta-lactamase-like protein [Chaetomium fimeti]
MTTPKPATDTIIRQQEEVKNSLNFADTRDLDDAANNLIGTRRLNVVTNANDDVVWDNDAYSFLQGSAPNEANPSLWRQSQLTSTNGLFRITDGIYQVRGLDLSNTTFIEGETGIIVIDPLTSLETGAAALQLYRDHRGEKPVKAVIYTHSHADHFGGVKGMVTQDDVDSGRVAIIAPEGFLAHAVVENVYAGTAMSRRAAYMYGAALPRGERGQIGAGLGQTVSTGEVTLIAPTDTITSTGDTRTVDGVRMEFQMAPDTEAPSEMLVYFPNHKALCTAEVTAHTFHNLVTLRGALVRNPHGWAKQLTQTIDLFGGRADVIFGSHHWPTWGRDNIAEFLTQQRDIYAYVHDQTLRMINQGHTGPEIAEAMVLPPALGQAWSARGYYGSLSHNVKAIYQRYLGWFDGNPSHLWEHTPSGRAKRYVDLLGGVDHTITAAQKAFDSGDFRWAAELLNHAVFADPNPNNNPSNNTNERARALLADTYEQLGYGAENSTWRNFFLSGTTELRTGNFGTPTATASPDMLAQLTPEMLFDSLAIQINGPAAWDVRLAIDVVVTDAVPAAATYRVWLSNGALVYTTATPQPTEAELTMTATSRQLTALAVYGPDPEKLRAAGVVLEGDTTALERLGGLLDPGDPNFNIVTP